MDDLFQHRKAMREPDVPRESIEPEADMEPDDARQFIFDLTTGIHHRMNELPDDDFEKPDKYHHLPAMEKAKQYYGNHRWQLFSGIEAALRAWDESGEETAELKEKYGGKFIEGVDIGERLAVYEGRDFTFVGSNGSQTDSAESSENDSNDSKFTFTH